MYITQHGFARGIFSDETVLYLHGMTDRAPFSLTMTFPRSYNAKFARETGIVCRTCSDDVLDLGRCETNAQHGNLVRVYDAERMPCDFVRGEALTLRSSCLRCGRTSRAGITTCRS